MRKGVVNMNNGMDLLKEKLKKRETIAYERSKRSG